jgi:hypothetical protein
MHLKIIWYIAFFPIKFFITKTFYPKKCATDLYSSDSINGKYVCFHSKMLGYEYALAIKGEIIFFLIKKSLIKDMHLKIIKY